MNFLMGKLDWFVRLQCQFHLVLTCRINGAVGALKRGGMLLALINSGSFLC